MSLDGEMEWYKRYAPTSVDDERKALYGRCMADLAKFIREHASEYEDVYALMDAARPQFRALLEATLGLVGHVAPQDCESSKEERFDQGE